MSDLTPPRPMRRWLQMTVGIIVACLFLYVAVRNVDLAKAITALSSVQLHQMTPIIVLSFMILWLRVWRWQLMFPSSSRPSGIAVFRAFAFGAFGNCVMPGRLGDLARAGIISRDVAAMGVSGALATVVVEKVMDGLAVLVLLAFALWFTPLPTWLILTGLVTTAIFAVALAFLFIVAKHEALSQNPFKLGPASSGSSKLIMALRGVTHRFSNGLQVVTSIRQLAVLLFLSLLIWNAESLIVYLSFRLFNISVQPAAAVVTIVFLTVGTMLPAAPGFIGTYQFFVISALTLYGVSESSGLALSIFMNLFAIGSTVAFALIALLMPLLFAKQHGPA